jgi:hypothetical protein
MADPLPNTLGDVKQKVRGLLGDPDGDWVTDGYITPIINVTYGLQVNALKNGTGKNLEAIIECLDIAIGTSSLYPLQAPSQPLFGLSDPLELWVKTAGQPPQWYTAARGPVDVLPNVQPPGITPGWNQTRVSFVWMGQQLSITPVNGPIDVKVYGRFNPPPLQKDEDVLVVYSKMSETTAVAAAAVAGVERSNPAVLAGYAEMAIAGLDDIIADIIRQTQRNPRRLGRMGGHSGYGGGYWFWA